MFRVLQRNRHPGYTTTRSAIFRCLRRGIRATTLSPPPIREDWIALTKAIVRDGRALYRTVVRSVAECLTDLRHSVDLVRGMPLWFVRLEKETMT
jgi:hypothetical protein